LLKVGITGGIGSGKSVICHVFAALGIPVFYSDDAARYLMENDAALIGSIRLLFGEDIYRGGLLDRQKVADIVFRDPDKLSKLNNLVHPAVIRYSRQWVDSRQAPYVIKESALFFETGTYEDMDVMVGVYAPEEVRIARAMSRSQATREQILARIAQQMDEKDKMSRCQHVIVNDDRTAVLPQVLQLHSLFLH
jgi:dephospho-CoA kinase